MTSFLKDGRSRPVAIWLAGVTLLVFAMIVVGGATRLTGSGLSITEWKPVSGVLPPLSHAEWLKDFALYQATPQYREVNAGMSLAEFQSIFWWEWWHRLLGRLVGAAFAIPFIGFLLMRDMPARLIWRCSILLALGALQGLVGWWMVESGLENRVSMAAARAVGDPPGPRLDPLRRADLDGDGGVERAGAGSRGAQRRLASVLSGVPGHGVPAMSAGGGGDGLAAEAGLIDNDWPLMNGDVFPADYAKASLWATLAHSQAATQFNHRMLAYAVVIAAVAGRGRRRG